MLVRSRDPYRVLRALISQVSTHVVPEGHSVLEGVAVGRSGRVVLMTNPQNRVAFERAAARLGLRVSDTPTAVIRSDPPAVVVGSLWPELDLAPLREIATRRTGGTGDPEPLEWGTHELVALAVLGAANAANVFGEMGPLSGPDLADAPDLHALLSLARSVRTLSGVGLEAVAAVVDGLSSVN